MMSKTLILQQQARRVLANHSIKTCLFRRSYKTLSAVKTDLDQWSKQGDQVKPSYVRGMIKDFQDSKKFSNALEASEWMCEQRVFTMFPEDYASRLHLIETVLGLEEAEKFFKTIPENMRNYTVYDNLLRSYTKSDKTLHKAEATFEKMRDLGFLLKPSPYNSMISLYGQLKKQDMVKKLQRELLESNVEISTLTEKEKFKREMYRVWNEFKKFRKMEDDECRRVISSLLRKDDVQGAEKIYEKWQPLGPWKLDMSIPGLLISWYRAKGNESKVEEVVKSIRTKRILMYVCTLIVALIMLVVITGMLAIGAAIMVGIISFYVILIIGIEIVMRNHLKPTENFYSNLLYPF